MTETDGKSLDAMYSDWPAEKLAKAMTIERDQYQPEAVVAMNRSLESRALTQEERETLFAAVKSEHEAELQRHSGIRGMLVLFILVLLGNAAWLVWRAIVISISAPTAILRFVGVPIAAVGLYGMYCSWLLITRRPAAPEHATRWIALAVMVAVGSAALDYALVGSFSTEYFGLAVFAIVWLPYLSQSRRVAVVYGIRQRGRTAP